MNLSIKKRIYWSFFILVLLFVANGIATHITLNNNSKLAENVSAVINPTLQTLENFEDLLIASKMYTTNWVFLRSSQEDKDALLRLHKIDYPRLKVKLNLFASKSDNTYMADSLQKIYTGFEQLLTVEKKIMLSLQKFKDYDDVVAKLESEMLVEDEVLPRTSALLNSLSNIVSYELKIRNEKNSNLEKSFIHLKMLISFLAFTIIFIGIFFSVYMARVIIRPINKIRDIVNDLGVGITRKVLHKITDDEIGEMVRSVNNLSEKLYDTAVFATEIGNRNFDSCFAPIGMKDVLGKALVAMRDNLKAGDKSLNQAQHIAKLGSWELDLLTGKLFWSDEIYNILDIDSTKFAPGNELYQSFIHPEDREQANTIVKKCLENHLPFTYECRIISDKNVLKILLTQGKISTNEKGELIKLTGIVQDISERKQAQKELEDVNRELSILFNSIDEIFFSVNITTLKVIQISATCEKLYGYNQSEFLANYNLRLDIIYPDDKYIIENENEILRRGGQANNQYRILHKDKSVRWVENKITPTLDRHGNLIRVDGVTRDITQRKLDEELLQKSQASLELNNHELGQKNKELEQFAYVASHDLQEPIRTTISFVKILKEQYYGKLDPKADKYLNYIIQASDRMSVLIKDLLDFSRIGVNKDLEQVDCNRILLDVFEDIDKTIKDTNAMIVADDLPVINGYPSEIKQLFQNLIMNAIKFRKPGIIPQINISVNQTGHLWNFAFADNGIGIDKAHNERIFIIFQRLHTRTLYEGSGIGLSHCKKIVELHHGKIWVESILGAGSTFYFTIPQINQDV